MRLTALWLIPHRRAIKRVLQCVASRGVDSRVSVSTRSTAASLISRGAPGRGSSSNPSNRRAIKRLRHFPNVCLAHLSSRLTTVFDFPCAQVSTRRAPLRKSLRRFRSARPPLQGLLLFGRQNQLRYRPSHAHLSFLRQMRTGRYFVYFFMAQYTRETRWLARPARQPASKPAKGWPQSLPNPCQRFLTSWPSGAP